jgi:hypothetical protein
MKPDDVSRRKARQRHGEISEKQRVALDEIQAAMQILLADAQPNRSRDEQAERDQEAIDVEEVFIRRFGFDWPKRERASLIGLKHRCDLTDREIRLLRWTGSLRRKNGIVALNASHGAAIFGKCIIVLMCLEFLLSVSADILGLHHALSLVQASKLYGAMSFVIALAWAVNLAYVRPWTIRRRVLDRLGSRQLTA